MHEKPVDAFFGVNYTAAMNWKTLVGDLVARGMSYRAIGKVIGTGPGNVHAIGAGLREDVMWSLGDKLITLHRKVMRRKVK
jgi:hypothetical protein